MDLEMKSVSPGSGQLITGDDKNSDTAIAIGDDGSNAKTAVDDGKGLVIGGSETDERVCRICQLSAKESGKTPLTELGCGCKGELAVAHSLCAEAWFRTRGISGRLCEICGETAKNITGVGDTSLFMEEWNENRPVDTIPGSPDGNGRCSCGQSLCNFLMACLVLAFVLSWFFRVNMF